MKLNLKKTFAKDNSDSQNITFAKRSHFLFSLVTILVCLFLIAVLRLPLGTGLTGGSVSVFSLDQSEMSKTSDSDEPGRADKLSGSENSDGHLLDAIKDALPDEVDVTSIQQERDSVTLDYKHTIRYNK